MCTQIPNQEYFEPQMVVFLSFRIINGDGAWYAIRIFVGR